MPRAAQPPDEARTPARAARLAPSVVAALETGKILGLRVGRTHRFIGLWPVVVDGRLFVRSWSQSSGGWHAAIRAQPLATIQVGARRHRVRAIQRRGRRLLAAVDAGYRAKFHTPGARAYVRDLCGARCRATTTELVPVARAP